ncbi:MAG: hypothetical protein ACFE8U_10890 [Candidatus Hermodarchaeota archaeon]
MSNRKTRINPKMLAKWWQEAEDQIKLAHPHESAKMREKLVSRYVQSRIKRHQSNQFTEPRPEDRMIASWYMEELLRLRQNYPDRPLKEREQEAANIVEQKIKHYRKIIRLDEFF